MEPKRRIGNINEEFDIKLFIHIARKNIFWIFIFLGISMTSAYFYLRYTHPVFESYSVIKLGAENKASEILAGSRVDPRAQNQIFGEIELIRSRVIFEKAIAALPLKISYYSKGAVLENEMYRTSPFAIEADLKDSSLMGIPIYVEFSKEKNQATIDFSDKFKERNGTYPIGEWIHLPELSLKITVSDFEDIVKAQTNKKRSSFFFVFNDQKYIVNNYLRNLDVILQNQEAQTIQIKFKDNNPLKTADVANSIANQFLHYDQDKLGEGSDKVLNFINEQLEIVNRDLHVSENLLERFKQGNKLVKPDVMANNAVQGLNDLENQKVAVYLEMDVLARLEQSINENKNPASLLPFLRGNFAENMITGMITSLATLQTDKEHLLLQATPESQEVKNINHRIDNQKKQLIDGLHEVKKSISERESKIDSSIYVFEKSLNSLPSKEAEYSRLERLYNINQKFYSLLLEKKTEFQIKKAGFVTTNILLQEATIPHTQISPNRSLIHSSAIIFGFLAGFILILIFYIFHNTISTLEGFEKYTNASRLGIVPKYKNLVPVSMLLVDKNPKSLISEAFRSIRTNLQFISNTTGPKVVAVTSTISGEGKTFIAINLGGVIAFSNKKVIILDLDMRKPKIHLGFNTENVRGMSTILIGRDSIEDCIYHSSLDSLDFITAGPIPPNPSELILSKKMTESIEYLKTKYDVIIIDTPPVGIVTDGIDIIQKADYPLYILRANYSKKIFIRNINKLIEENNINRLSVILNNAEMVNSKYGYSYGYGYGYNYGYGGYYGGYGYGYYEDDKSRSANFFKRLFFRK